MILESLIRTVIVIVVGRRAVIGFEKDKGRGQLAESRGQEAKRESKQTKQEGLGSGPREVVDFASERSVKGIV